MSCWYYSVEIVLCIYRLECFNEERYCSISIRSGRYRSRFWCRSYMTAAIVIGMYSIKNRYSLLRTTTKRYQQCDNSVTIHWSSLMLFSHERTHDDYILIALLCVDRWEISIYYGNRSIVFLFSSISILYWDRFTGSYVCIVLRSKIERVCFFTDSMDE